MELQDKVERCDHGVVMPKDAQGEWILDLPWWRQCVICNFLGWADNTWRRLQCRFKKHQLHTEYRCEVDFYGETWCQRCGEYEPTKWCPE